MNRKIGPGYAIFGGETQSLETSGIFYVQLFYPTDTTVWHFGANVLIGTAYGTTIQIATKYTIHSSRGTGTTNQCKCRVGLNIPPIVICDYGWNIKQGTAYTMFGGNCTYGAKNGTFSCFLSIAIGYSYWDVGANVPSIRIMIII